MIANAPQLEVKPATLLTPGAVVRISLFGLVLVVPVLVSMMVVSVMQFGLLTFFIPLAVIAVATFFLPVGFGNPLVARLVRPLQPDGASAGSSYVVQLTRNPRARSGLLAVLDDADDIGFLNFTSSGLVFNGDSVRLSTPYERIRELRLRNAGWRALFAYGPSTSFSVDGLSKEGSFIFAERSSWLLPASRKIGKQLYEQLKHGVEGTASPPRLDTDEPDDHQQGRTG